MAAFSGKAANADQAELAFEYHELFTGLTRGELIPYASYYLTGFLNEKPLAKLRNAMMTLDIQSDPNSADPEDHIAAILDMMAGLILGDLGAMGAQIKRAVPGRLLANPDTVLHFGDDSAADSAMGANRFLDFDLSGTWICGLGLFDPAGDQR